jgi:DNA repair exonuclease SbcCD ATPase subunit
LQFGNIFVAETQKWGIFAMENEKNLDLPEETAEVPEKAEQTPTAPNCRELAELDAYIRHSEALRVELQEIREKYGVENGEIPPDPLKEIRAEMEQMRNGFAEIKSMFAELRNNTQSNATQPIQQPQQAYYYQQAPQPPLMPYYQTPNIMPIVPALPTFNLK